MSRVIEETRGRWQALLPALGVRAEYLTGKNGPCPFCGGRDRWRFLNTDGNGTWICNQCGAGNGFEIVKRILKVEFRDAVLAVENLLRTAPPANEPKPKDHASLREEAKRTWNRAQPLGHDETTEYLRSRAIDLPTWPKALRHAPHVMLGKIITANNVAINLHRTFLPRGPKKYMAGVVPAGSAIRLMPHVGILGIAEGIETALSVYLLFGVPCWAACDAHHVASFTPPAEVSALCIYADNDSNFVGQNAAYATAQRLRAKGLIVSVKVPDDADTDWNDVMKNRGTV
jgi:putative DNA primase/helicase